MMKALCALALLAAAAFGVHAAVPFNGGPLLRPLLDGTAAAKPQFREGGVSGGSACSARSLLSVQCHTSAAPGTTCCPAPHPPPPRS